MKYLFICSRSRWELNCTLDCTPLFLNNTQSRLTVMHIYRITGIERTVEICIVLPFLH